MVLVKKDIALSLIVILLWVSIWGIVDIIIDNIVIDNPQYTYIAYIILLIISLILYYIIDANL
jgi:drug/metabolite transporter (DMT)-like permease